MLYDSSEPLSLPTSYPVFGIPEELDYLSDLTELSDLEDDTMDLSDVSVNQPTVPSVSLKDSSMKMGKKRQILSHSSCNEFDELLEKPAFWDRNWQDLCRQCWSCTLRGCSILHQFLETFFLPSIGSQATEQSVIAAVLLRCLLLNLSDTARGISGTCYHRIGCPSSIAFLCV